MADQYFPHDYNPLDDPAMVLLVDEYGAAGYGIFWRIIERLHKEESHRLPLKHLIYASIGKQMKTDVEQVSTVVEFCMSIDIGLFVSDGEFFWSERVNRNIDKRAQISNQRSVAGKASAEAKKIKALKSEEGVSTVVEHVLTPVKQPSADVQQTSTNLNKGKENKGKEIKEKKSKENYSLHFVPADFLEVFKSWLEYKKSKGQTYKNQKSVELCFKSLQELSKNNTNTAREIIESAMSKNYAGFFPITEKTNSHESKQIHTRSASPIESGKGFGKWD